MKRFYSLLMLISALVASVSCSVKEDRDSCPCLVLLDCSHVDVGMLQDAEVFIYNYGDLVWKDSLRTAVQSGSYVALVPRGSLHLSIWSGTEGYAAGDGLQIPVGEDCPHVYMFDADARAVSDEYRVAVEMRKNYCVMRILTEYGTDFPLKMKVVGNVDGYTSDGLPDSGLFEYPLNVRSYNDGWEVNVPRQSDSSLSLQVDDGSGDIRSFALGQYIVSSGYDWNAPDLKDVTVSLDYALTELTIRVSGWEETYTFDIEI